MNNTAGLTTTPGQRPAEAGTPADAGRSRDTVARPGAQAAPTESPGVVSQLDDRIEWRLGDSGWYTPSQYRSATVESGQIPTQATGYSYPHGHWQASLRAAMRVGAEWVCTYLVEPTQGKEAVPCEHNDEWRR